MTSPDTRQPLMNFFVSPKAAERLCDAALELGSTRDTMFDYDVNVVPETGKTSPTQLYVTSLGERAGKLVYLLDPGGKRHYVRLEGVKVGDDDPLSEIFRTVYEEDPAS